MTYYGGKEMADAFRTVRGNTVKIAEEIPEDKYGFSAAPGTRTVAQMLVHTALGPTFQLHVQGNKITDMTAVNFPELFQKIGAEEGKSRTKAEIVAFLKSEGDRFASFLEGLQESFLAETVAMMPGTGPARKSRLEMLLSAKEHEMHHRAQLMLIERMLDSGPHLTRQFQERMAAQAASRG